MSSLQHANHSKAWTQRATIKNFDLDAHEYAFDYNSPNSMARRALRCLLRDSSIMKLLCCKAGKQKPGTRRERLSARECQIGATGCSPQHPLDGSICQNCKPLEIQALEVEHDYKPKPRDLYFHGLNLTWRRQRHSPTTSEERRRLQISASQFPVQRMHQVAKFDTPSYSANATHVGTFTLDPQQFHGAERCAFPRVGDP